MERQIISCDECSICKFMRVKYKVCKPTVTKLTHFFIEKRAKLIEGVSKRVT